MKTVYSIGRDPGCDIYLYDDNNLISRTHAVLKVGKGGKYFISDQSMNGTYINGIKVAPGVQVPVTRKDVITFAHVAELDWNLIPNTMNGALKAIIIIAATLVVGAGAAFGIIKYLELRNDSYDAAYTAPDPEKEAAAEAQMKEARAQELIDIEKKIIAEEQKKQEKARKQKAAEEKAAKEKADKEKAAQQAAEEENKNVDPII